VHNAEPGSLVGLIAKAPSSELTKPERQVTHWLFALGDTLAVNALRCLALLAIHDEERTRALEDPGRLDGCLQEAMRLWPTTPMLARVIVHDTDWDGVAVPAGTQVLIVNTFNHRDGDAIELADSFTPDRWSTGSGGEDWLFNHFSHGPQGCPGANLALLVGKAMIAALLRDRELTLVEPELDPTLELPHALDFFSLRLDLPER
jgi:cytochrome P450